MVLYTGRTSSFFRSFRTEISSVFQIPASCRSEKPCCFALKRMSRVTFFIADSALPPRVVPVFAGRRRPWLILAGFLLPQRLPDGDVRLDLFFCEEFPGFNVRREVDPAKGPAHPADRLGVLFDGFLRQHP